MRLEMFSNLCHPAKYYLEYTIIFIFVAFFNKLPIFLIILDVLFSIFWVYLLNYLCEKGKVDLARGLVWFPLIIIFILWVLLLLYAVQKVGLAKVRNEIT